MRSAFWYPIIASSLLAQTDAAAQAPQRDPAPTTATIISQIADTSSTARANRAALAGIGSAAEGFVPSLLSLLSDERPQARIGASDALYQIAIGGNLPGDAVPALLLALGDTLAVVRVAVLRAATAAAPDRAETYGAVVRTLESDPHPLPRRFAARLAGDVAGADPSAMISTLLQRFEDDPDTYTRYDAARTLQRLAPEDPRVIDVLSTLRDRMGFIPDAGRSAVVTILPSSKSLLSDGRGPYRDGEESVLAYAAESQSLVVCVAIRRISESSCYESHGGA
jgi:hypothetical protein